MANSAPRYLTVKEAAERLRASPQTVYRWCRSGRIKAVKLGKEWRIPADQLEGDPQLAGLLSLEVSLAGLAGASEHLLVLASDQLALGRMQTAFCDAAAAGGARLMYGRWAETETEVRQRLRPALSNAQGGEARPHLLNFMRTYEKQGVQGPVRLLSEELTHASADGAHCCFYNSPSSFFAYNDFRLLELERGMHEVLRGHDTMALCGHTMSDLFALHGAGGLTLLMELANCHSGVLCFDGQRALLVRPTGRAA